MNKIKRKFEKGYLSNVSKEIFTCTICKPIVRNRPLYKLMDNDAEELKGKFYDKELQKVCKHDDIYEVEKIVKKKGKGKNYQYHCHGG